MNTSKIVLALLIAILILSPFVFSTGTVTVSPYGNGISVAEVYCGVVSNSTPDGYVQIYRMLVQNGSSFPSVTFGLTQYQKAAVGVILIGTVIAIALELNHKVRKKKKMRRPGSDTKGKRDPNLTPSSYPGRKPRWKHPRPKEEDYAR